MIVVKKKVYTPILVITNILTVIILALFLLRELFPTVIDFHLSTTKKTLYQDTKSYKSIMSIYQQQKNIVLLGSSLTSEVKWCELLDRCDIAERGLGGNTTGDMLRRLNYVWNVNPKICFIEGGINDLTRKVEEDSILKNIKTIVSVLQEKKIIPVLNTVVYVADCYNDDAAELNSRIKKHNAALKQFTTTMNIKLIDINPLITTLNFRKKEFATEDGLHFTGKAYLVWKDKITEALSCFENLLNNKKVLSINQHQLTIDELKTISNKK
jgi:lysophospholipase L1-like esterase